MILNTLLREGDSPGTVIEVGLGNRSVVKLDCQEQPVCAVIYYEEQPREVHSSLWQICYPIPCVTCEH